MLKKILNIWLNEGFSSVLSKSKKKLRSKCHTLITHLADRLESDTETNKLQNLLTNNQAKPIAFFKSTSPTLRVNIVTDSVKKQSLFGGVATSLIVATFFANRQNIPLRIICRTTKTNPKDYDDFLRLMKIPRPKKVEFFSDINENAPLLEVSDLDIFLSTSWWSSKVVQQINQRSSFFYLLQEVELFFYPHSDEYWQCQNVLQNKNIRYLINTKILHDYYRDQGFTNVASNSTFFEPSFPAHLYEATEASFLPKKKWKFFFYSRPNNKRNLFKTGLEILDAALVRGIINEEEWEIYFAGSDIPEITFSTGLTPKILGQMSWQEYIAFAKTVDLCLSLMYTPHPSYPPLDIAASGGVSVTNTYPGKESLPYSNNILCVSLDLESMLRGLEKGIALAKNSEVRRQNYSYHQISRDWNKSLESTVQYMVDAL